MANKDCTKCYHQCGRATFDNEKYQEQLKASEEAMKQQTLLESQRVMAERTIDMARKPADERKLKAVWNTENTEENRIEMDAMKALERSIFEQAQAIAEGNLRRENKYVDLRYTELDKLLSNTIANIFSHPEQAIRSAITAQDIVREIKRFVTNG